MAAETLHEALALCGATPSAACLGAIEAQALKRAGSRVRRDATLLSLQTPAGPVRFEVAKGHHYLGAIEGSDADLVLSLPPGAPLASGRYWLVGSGGPPVLGMEDLPWPAPGGRLLAVVRPAVGKSLSSLALYLRAGSRWTLQYRYEAPPGVSYQFKSWRSDAAALRLDWQAAATGTACSKQASSGVIQLRDGPYGWDLVPPLPQPCP